MSDLRPVLLVFAGPNGSGKTTLARIIFADCPDLPRLYINADSIAHDLSVDAYEAAQRAELLRNQAIGAGVSFVMETVLSIPDKVELLRKARQRGYRIFLEYITTQDPLINVERVRGRVRAGGHDVPEEKIISRYERSMRLLPEAARTADEVSVYDNSSTEPILIAKKPSDGRWVIYPQEPPGYWNGQRIKGLLVIDDPLIVRTTAKG